MNKMKKNLFALMALLGWSLQMMATDGISAADITVPKGGTNVLEVEMESVEKSYGGFQFEVKLPAGISATKAEKTARLTAIDGYTLSMNLTDAENNIYTVLGYNMSHESIGGTTGAIVNITLQADAALETGTELNGALQNVVLSTVNAEDIDASNSAFTITIGEDRIILDETSTTAPVAATGVNVRVKRAIKANSWSTICLPFAIPAEKITAAFGAGVEVKDFTGYDIVESGEDIVGITISFQAATAMLANHPYLIKVANAITYDDGFTVDGVDIDPEDEPIVSFGFTTGKGSKAVYHPADFVGTYVADTTVPENDLFISNNKFYYSAGATNMKAFRAYFEFDDVLTALDEAGARISILDEDVTGIANVKTLSVESSDYYDLQGRKVANPGKGLYINNGRKVVKR